MRVAFPAVTTFFGSFLLFGIQPMLGRTLLFPFGGSATVWTVCLAAYQILLFLGYAYAHALAHRSPQLQRRLHLGFLIGAVFWTLGFAALRLVLRDRLGATGFPSLEVFACVLIFVGLPYVLLSANSTLIQTWLVCSGADDVYWLYAISNFGSLSGLLIYPFLLEPFVSLSTQWYGFSFCLLLYTLLLCAVAKATAHPHSPLSEPQPPTTVSAAHSPNLPPALTRPWLWFALPALSAFLLNAVTTHLSTDVTPVPMMWVLLLAAFLLSYFIGFSTVGEKGLIIWVSLSIPILAGTAFVSGQKDGRAFLPNFSFGILLLLTCCTCLHSWLYRIRPQSSKLTRFYLSIAGGGALGGLLASLLSPVLFDRVWEYPIGLLLLCASCAWLVYDWDHPEVKGLTRFLLGVSVVSTYIILSSSITNPNTVLIRTRNFYACLRVEKEERTMPDGSVMTRNGLVHGETLHGVQIMDRTLRHTPTMYYASTGGGLALTSHPNYANPSRPMRVGIVGLGAGTLACYGRTNDFYRFFEINPDVIFIASNTNFFSFVSDSSAEQEILLGDARKQLEIERTKQKPLYDVLVIDAFSGDSVPFHLITREAFQLYLDRLAPDGILALHISNWHIDLAPLCKAASKQFGVHISGIVAPDTAAHWVFLTRRLINIGPVDAQHTRWESIRDIEMPADEKGSLLPLIKIGLVAPSKLDVDLIFR